MKTQRIPFDLEKVKAGAKVVTRTGLSARIVDYKVNDKNYPVLGLVTIEGIENPYKFTINGKFYINKDDVLDLFIEEVIKPRRMTRQELSWWLRDCQEEHREYMLEGGFRASADYDYLIGEADEEVGKVYIRKNGGEWQEPFVEE